MIAAGDRLAVFSRCERQSAILHVQVLHARRIQSGPPASAAESIFVAAVEGRAGTPVLVEGALDVAREARQYGWYGDWLRGLWSARRMLALVAAIAIVMFAVFGLLFTDLGLDGWSAAVAATLMLTWLGALSVPAGAGAGVAGAGVAGSSRTDRRDRCRRPRGSAWGRSSVPSLHVVVVLLRR